MLGMSRVSSDEVFCCKAPLTGHGGRGMCSSSAVLGKMELGEMVVFGAKGSACPRDFSQQGPIRFSSAEANCLPTPQH